MNWWRAQKLYRKRAVDYRYEHDVLDRADKWLRAVENRQRERRGLTTASSSAARGTGR